MSMQAPKAFVRKCPECGRLHDTDDGAELVLCPQHAKHDTHRPRMEAEHTPAVRVPTVRPTREE